VSSTTLGCATFFRSRLGASEEIVAAAVARIDVRRHRQPLIHRDIHRHRLKKHETRRNNSVPRSRLRRCRATRATRARGSRLHARVVRRVMHAVHHAGDYAANARKSLAQKSVKKNKRLSPHPYVIAVQHATALSSPVFLLEAASVVMSLPLPGSTLSGLAYWRDATQPERRASGPSCSCTRRIKYCSAAAVAQRCGSARG
jgi:hypothetical protein